MWCCSVRRFYKACGSYRKFLHSYIRNVFKAEDSTMAARFFSQYSFFIVCFCIISIVTSTVHFNQNSWLRAQRQPYAQRVSYICIYVKNGMNVTSFICIILICIQLIHRYRQSYAYSSNRQHLVA